MTAAVSAPILTKPADATGPVISPAQAVEFAAIDASARGPVLFFFGNGILWLLLSTALGLIASLQLMAPGVFGDVPFLSYGRIWPAYMNALGYGWASLAGMGAAIWLMARLCRSVVRMPGVLIGGAIFWQIGLTVGIISILAGKTTALEGLEIPRSSAALMLFGYLLVGLWGVLLFGFRRQTVAYISVWYALAALMWFPWTFAIGHFATALPAVQGVMQNVIAAWATQNFLNVFLTAIGLAVAYYLIPKVINRPVHSYHLATIGFWSFIFCSGLTGIVRLSGGPVPAWLVTFSIAANILLLVQIVTVASNLVLTMRGQYHMVYHSPTIRFTFFAVIAFLLASVLGLFSSLRSVDRVLHFTQFQNAQTHLVIYAFFSMAIFGAIYYILPRLVGCEWLSSTMISLHFWGSAYGGGMMIALLLFSGIASGLSFVDPAATFAQAMEIDSVYRPGRLIAWALVSVGHLIFGVHFLLMLLRIGQPGGEPTLFVPFGEEKH